MTNEILTDSFPSQFPSQIALFRHNFINFPSQFPSQIATFSVVHKKHLKRKPRDASVVRYTSNTIYARSPKIMKMIIMIDPDR